MILIHLKFNEGHFRDFPGGQVVKMSPSNAGGGVQVQFQSPVRELSSHVQNPKTESRSSTVTNSIKTLKK